MQFTLVSVYPHNVASQFDYGRYELPAAPLDGGYTKLRIADYQHPQGAGFGAAFTKISAGWDDDRGEPKFHLRPVSAEEITGVMEKEWQHVGVLRIQGDDPAPEELKLARERMISFFIEQIKEADKEWALAQSRNRPSFISSLQKEAGLYLHRMGHPLMNEPRRWMAEDTGVQMQDCPVCMVKIPSGAIKCRHCGAILDAQRAAQFGIYVALREAPPPSTVQPEPAMAGAEPAKRGPGRPRKE